MQAIIGQEVQKMEQEGVIEVTLPELMELPGRPSKKKTEPEDFA